MKSILHYVLPAALICGLAQAEPAPPPVSADPFEALASELSLTAVELTPVAVGDFKFEDSELMTPFSAMLRKELERVLPRTGRFSVVPREGLSDLQKERKFQELTGREPVGGSAGFYADAAKAIVRGRFFYRDPDVTVYAELVRLDGGVQRTAKTMLKAETVCARILPAGAPDRPAPQAALCPQNPETSAANLAAVSNAVQRIPRHFKLELTTVDGRRDYAAGETVSFRLRAPVDCYVAVFCHQSDGSVVQLFPNAWNMNMGVSAGRVTDIPGPVKSGFEVVIGAPFGADVVQAIACTKRSELHRKASEVAAAAGDRGYGTLTRGMFAREASESPISEAQGPAQWAEARLVVSTYPAMK